MPASTCILPYVHRNKKNRNLGTGEALPYKENTIINKIHWGSVHTTLCASDDDAGSTIQVRSEIPPKTVHKYQGIQLPFTSPSHSDPASSCKTQLPTLPFCDLQCPKVSLVVVSALTCSLLVHFLDSACHVPPVCYSFKDHGILSYFKFSILTCVLVLWVILRLITALMAVYVDC